MTEQPSRTSILVAAARAVGSRFDNPHWRSPDYLAIKLLGPAEREAIASDPVAEALEIDKPDLSRNPRVLGIVMTMVVRTKFIDERLQKAVVDGATQIVILGAGWDTRAYRFANLLNAVRVFEVDRPALQAWKRRRAEETFGPPPENLTYLQIDFQTQTLSDVTAASAYDPSQKTFFIWEGVTMYLPEGAVRETLQWIARQAPGSTLVFDFVDPSVIDFMNRVNEGYEPRTDEAAGVVAARSRQLSNWAEPWIFGIPADASEDFVNKLGFEHRETMAMASIDAAKRYLGWDREPFAAPIRRNYLILEAAVKPR